MLKVHEAAEGKAWDPSKGSSLQEIIYDPAATTASGERYREARVSGRKAVKKSWLPIQLHNKYHRLLIPALLVLTTVWRFSSESWRVAGSNVNSGAGVFHDQA